MKYSAFIEAEGISASQLDFLAKAVSNDLTRYFMNYIHVEPSDKGEGLLGVATDGRRLHVVDPLPEALVDVFGLTPGYWKVLKNNSKNMWIARLDDSQTDVWVFPNWRKVIPMEKAVHENTFEGFDLSKDHHNSVKLTIFLRDLPEATAIDLNFLHSLGTNHMWRVEWRGPQKALKLTAGNCMAVLMPMVSD